MKKSKYAEVSKKQQLVVLHGIFLRLLEKSKIKSEKTLNKKLGIKNGKDLLNHDFKSFTPDDYAKFIATLIFLSLGKKK